MNRRSDKLKVISFKHLKIYPPDKWPTLTEMIGYRTHTCNKQFIKRMAFKYHLSSEFPQPYLLKLGIPQASALVNIKGIKVHLVMQFSSRSESFGLWTFPHNKENIAWFEYFFSNLVDMSNKYSG